MTDALAEARRTGASLAAGGTDYTVTAVVVVVIGSG